MFLRKFELWVGFSRFNYNLGDRKITFCTKYCLDRPKNTTANRHISQKTSKVVNFVKKKKQNGVSVDVKEYMRDTIMKLSNFLRYPSWESTREHLEKLPVKWDSYTVNQVLKTHPPMEKAWLFFNWASKLKGFKHDQFTCTTMLDIFGEAGRISSMNYVFREMQGNGIKIDAVTYTSLLHWLSKYGDVDGSVRLWQEMRSKGCHPTVVSYTAYMKVLFDHDRVKEATEVYKEMLDSGCSPNCHTYTVLMEHLADSGKFDEVLDIFTKMQEAGVRPDKAACNILVEKCCRAGQAWAMNEILRYMKENHLVLRFPVYQLALETLRIAQESDVLLKQVNRHFSVDHFSKEQANKPDSTYLGSHSSENERLVLYRLTKQSLLAIDCLLVEMMGKSIKLDVRIIQSIVKVNFARCRQSGALSAFEYSVKLSINLERTAYLAMIGELIRANSFKKTVDIFKSMVEARIPLSSNLSALLIYRLGCAKELASAVDVFSLLPCDNRTTAAYTALIGAYFGSGDADKALETFETMRGRGVKVALATYCVLLNGLERCGRVRELEYYRKGKKSLEAETHMQEATMEDITCNLLFAGTVF